MNYICAVCFILLYCMSGQIIAYYSQYWWRFAKVPVHLISDSHYENYFKENPSYRYHIQKSVIMAETECKSLFKYQRWNCESNNPFLKPFGDIVEIGCRETAFIYALTSASLSFHMVHACSQGRIDGCYNWCVLSKQKEKNIDLKYIKFMNETHLKNLLCDDNIRFGVQVWNDFVWKGETSSDIRAQFNLRNSQVGLQEVLNSASLKCHCVGVSGSCTSKICSEKIPETFKTVSKELYRHYKYAKFNTPNQKLMEKRSRELASAQRNFKTRGLRHKRHFVSTLEFFDYSPDFCEKSKHSLGIKNRVCQPHVSVQEYDSGVRSCDDMCCYGRGSKVVEKLVRTNCTFVYCCHVKCNETIQNVEEFYCF